MQRLEINSPEYRNILNNLLTIKLSLPPLSPQSPQSPQNIPVSPDRVSSLIKLSLPPLYPQSPQNIPVSPVITSDVFQQKFTGNKDVDMIILSKLNYNQLFNICLINKYVNDLCKNDNLWKNRFRMEYGDGYGQDLIDSKPKNLSWFEYGKSMYYGKTYQQRLYYTQQKIEDIEGELIRRNIKKRGSKKEMVEWIIDDELNPHHDPGYWTLTIIDRINNEKLKVKVKPEETLTQLRKRLLNYRGFKAKKRLRLVIPYDPDRRNEHDIIAKNKIWKLLDNKSPLYKQGVKDGSIIILYEH
jgi:hypothetical protein